MCYAVILLVSANFWSELPSPAEPDPGVYCDEEQPTHCSHPVARGGISLLDGQVLSIDAAISLGLKAHECDERIRIFLDAEKERGRLLLDLEKQRRQIDQEMYEESLRRTQKALDDASGVPIYEEPIVVAVVTAVLTGLVVIGSGKIWSEAVGAGQ